MDDPAVCRVELVIANIVEPWVYSRSTGLSAVAVVAAAVFWTWLWGIVGLLLATPLTVCLVVLGRYMPQLQFLDILLGNRPVLSPQETLYQRLLARDPEEAAEQAEEFARDKSIDGVFRRRGDPGAGHGAGRQRPRRARGNRRAAIAESFAAMLDNLAEEGWVELGEPARTAPRSSASPAATSSTSRRPGCCSTCCGCAAIAAP